MRMQRGGVLEHDALAAGPTDLLPIKPRMRISMRARHGITGVDAGAGFPIREAGRPVAMSALRITLCPGVVRSRPSTKPSSARERDHPFEQSYTDSERGSWSSADSDRSWSRASQTPSRKQRA